MIKVPTGWRVYYWCTLLSQSKPCDLRVTRRVNSLFPSNSNLPRLPGWPWLRTPCCLAGLADCLLCSPPVLSSCLAVPLTHVWTAASTARHRQAHHTTPHHTTQLLSSTKTWPANIFFGQNCQHKFHIQFG